jgi:hypothetical protein
MLVSILVVRKKATEEVRAAGGLMTFVIVMIIGIVIVIVEPLIFKELAVNELRVRVVPPSTALVLLVMVT